jgi:hypothetical protein
MVYVTLKVRWCDIIVMNVHAATEGKDDVKKDSFYEELEQVFDHYVSEEVLSGYQPGNVVLLS